MLESSSESRDRVVVISGYANPIHAGHVEYARQARQLAGDDGTVVFIVNNDAQAKLKRGYTFVPQSDRMAVVGALKYVDTAVLSIDTDRTVCATLQQLAKSGVVCRDGVSRPPTHFANGGDVTPGSPCPETSLCDFYDIALVYGLGDKIQSSSWIIRDTLAAAAAVEAHQRAGFGGPEAAPAPAPVPLALPPFTRKMFWKGMAADPPMIILLGHRGAGKTTLAQYILDGLKRSGRMADDTELWDVSHVLHEVQSLLDTPRRKYDHGFVVALPASFVHSNAWSNGWASRMPPGSVEAAASCFAHREPFEAVVYDIAENKFFSFVKT
jgi:D-beta-D-heptose 7-phosphate kinase/D-beta-D-heptose 1-phosphate adenosyltransferase